MHRPRLTELHRHLDGSLRRATLDDLGRAAGVAVPDDLGFRAGMGLEAALACFEITLATLQTPAAVRRVADEMCVDAATEGVEHLEIRFAPQLHRGAKIEAIVDAALEGVDGRASLILCGLYGEPPALLERLVEVATPRPGVVGLDLAGGPTPTQSWSLEDYAPAFTRARDRGLGRTVHAGEGRPPAEIRVAVEALHAQRIGHGTSLLDDPAVLDLVLRRGVTIEACPTSNLHTGVIARADAHPLPRWLDLGVRVALCTDNTLLSAVDLPTERARAAALPGMTPARLAATDRHAAEARFTR
ncbi:MAG: adenosine deaminase family protein [Myxococcales bacterium]|nr:adenosine deaminase family protein [Myxococcales bacterium]